MDIELTKSRIKTNVYHIKKNQDISLHKHINFDEVFYCLKGSGFGVLEKWEQEMNVGDTFIVKENTMHSLRTDSGMWVASFLIPVVNDVSLQ